MISAKLFSQLAEIQELIGVGAGICTTIAFFPQIVHCIKTRSAEDLSLSMYIIFTTGVSLWIIYGLIIGSFSLVMANSITLFFTSIILAIKIQNNFRNKFS